MKSMRVVSLILVSSILSGCGLSTPVAVPELRTYTLSNVNPSALASRHSSAKILLVSLPIPDPGYQSSAMVYEPLPFDLRKYANHQWAAPPAQMIMPLLAQAITNRGYFKGVVTTPFTGVTDYRLDSRLVALKQNFIEPVSREQLILQETLTNNITNKVMASKRFSATVSAPQNNPYSGVVAANKAVSIVTGQIARWVVARVG